MQTLIQNQKASIVLKDGNIQLAAWTHSFDQRPTVGETIEIPARLQAALAGYEPVAVVSGIERRDPLPNLIEVAAVCRKSRRYRPVIVINSNRIPKSLRGEAETYLRSTLRFPIIDWEPRNQPDPVVRFHDPSTGRNFCPPRIRAGLLELLYQPASV